MARYIRKVQKEAVKKKESLLSLNYPSVQECVFNCDIKEKYDHLCNSYYPSYFKKNRTTLSNEKIIEDIRNGQLLGPVEVDIYVKLKLIEKFKEFPAFLHM